MMTASVRSRKLSLALPEGLIAAVDQAARARGESRNRFVARVLSQAVRAGRDAKVTGRLDRLFSDPELVREQVRTAGDLDAAGTDWSNESW